MRLAYLSTHYPSVSHTFIQGEILALEQRGVEVVPVALNAPDPGDLQTEIDHHEADRTFYVKAVPRPTMLRTFARTLVRCPGAVARGLVRAVRLGRADGEAVRKGVLQLLEAILVWDHLRTRDVDGIHAHFGQAPASVAWWTAWFAGAAGEGRWTWSVTIHGWHEFVTEDTSQLRSKLSAADLVVCISDYTRAQLLRIAPRTAWERIHVVRCGIDLSAFPPRSPAAVGTSPTIVITARLSPEKGHQVLLDAVARLRDEGVATRVRIIGEGPSRVDVEEAIRRLDLDGSVVLTGALPPEAVGEELRRADVFCLPTFAEGLPISLMEAMAVGVPVVTTYISGIPELVTDDESGWIVPAGSVEDLVTALRQALTSPRREAVIEEARHRVRSRHDRTINVVALHDLLRDCHGSRPPTETATAPVVAGTATGP